MASSSAPDWEFHVSRSARREKKSSGNRSRWEIGFISRIRQAPARLSQTCAVPGQYANKPPSPWQRPQANAKRCPEKHWTLYTHATDVGSDQHILVLRFSRKPQNVLRI